MRSVVVHFATATEREVTDYLAHRYPEQPGPGWVESVDGDPCLYIDFYADHELELEDDEIARLRSRFGGALPLSVIANVSGRHTGVAQVYDFVGGLLRRFDGLATDEYTDHYWTLGDLGTGWNGIAFFDYLGAYYRG